MEDVAREDPATELARQALGIRPDRVVRQLLSNSGKQIYRIYLPGGESIVLRIGTSAATFAYTKYNLNVLRSLGLPVQSVLASGRTRDGGSYIVLDWVPGRDLIYELSALSHLQTDSVARKVVDYQQRMARLPLGGGFGWAQVGAKAPLRNWNEMFGTVDENITVEDGSGLGNLQTRIHRLRARMQKYLAQVKPVAFLDDLTAKNVIVEHGELRGVIDVDYICYGDPLLSVGATVAMIAEQGAETDYGQQLLEMWNPDEAQRTAVWFYAAVMAMGTLQAMDWQSRDTLGRRIENWLKCAGV